MLGFEIKINDRAIKVPLDAGLTVLMRMKDERGDEMLNVNSGLYIPETDEMKSWIAEELKVGDEITVEMKKIDSYSEVIENYNYHERLKITKEEADQKALERYLALKKELEEEGAI